MRSLWSTRQLFSTNETGLDMCVDSHGNAIVLGRSNAGSESTWILQKLGHLDGSLMWASSWSDSRYPLHVYSDKADNVFVSGYTSTGIYTTYAGGARDAYVEKINGSDGTVLWGTQFGTDEEDWASAAVSQPFGHVFVIGSTRGNMFGTQYPTDSYFVIELHSNGTMLRGFQDGNTNEDTLFETHGVALAIDDEGWVYAAGDTGGLYGRNRDGGDIFVVKFPSSNISDWNWAVQHNGKSGFDWVGSFALDNSDGAYALGYTLMKVNTTNGALMWTKYAAQGDAMYSAMDVGPTYVFLVGRIRATTATDAFAVGQVEDRGTLGVFKWETHIEVNGSDVSALAAAVHWDTEYLYITRSAKEVHSTTYSSNEDIYVTKVHIYDDYPPLPSLGYSLDSPAVITVIVILSAIPILTLATFASYDPSIQFFTAFCVMALPLLDFLTDLLYLMTMEFKSVHILNLCIVDLLFINIIPVLFYELVVFADGEGYKASAESGGHYTPILDALCIVSVDAKNFFKDYEADDSWPCRGDKNGRRHPCNFLWTAFVALASVVVMCVDVGIKYVFYKFMLLSYLFKSQREYAKDNLALNRRARNYEFLTHVCTETVVQFVAQMLNNELLGRRYSPIAIISLSVTALNLAVGIYLYIIRFAV
eukprot:CAMPEP_0185031092 /NCGR_PEP_ID=MMETSP1103-20130426/18365_1 /TAXON_ID=36769 /ORGANISM="Paraphysomonas bandaiensis, Strain Caron Lab Isolate" /LENGTH=646 /DNA_ID=CAMNT_0027566479 /DNA_START=129 /DNA_END=2066 /DNA_ORIENTATION=+